MTRVVVSASEWYPVPTYEIAKDEVRGVVDIPQEVLDEYDRALKRFNAAADALIEAAGDSWTW